MNGFGQKHVLLAGAAGRAVLCCQLMEGCAPALCTDGILTNVTKKTQQQQAGDWHRTCMDGRPEQLWSVFCTSDETYFSLFENDYFKLSHATRSDYSWHKAVDSIKKIKDSSSYTFHPPMGGQISLLCQNVGLWGFVFPSWAHTLLSVRGTHCWAAADPGLLCSHHGLGAANSCKPLFTKSLCLVVL